MNNLDEYFVDKDKKYYDVGVLVRILEDIMGKSIKELKEDIKEEIIVVNAEEIRDYLERKQYLDKKVKDKVIPEAVQEFIEELKLMKYGFSPYALEYFNKYTDILRNKALKLLDIIEKIGSKDIKSIKDTLIDLDVRLDNEKILKSDIIRLVKPTVWNIKALKDKVREGNDLRTYLTFKGSRHKGFTDEEIYPSEALQVKHLYSNEVEGNVTLSENQNNELLGEQGRHLKRIMDLVKNV